MNLAVIKTGREAGSLGIEVGDHVEIRLTDDRPIIEVTCWAEVLAYGSTAGRGRIFEQRGDGAQVVVPSIISFGQQHVIKVVSRKADRDEAEAVELRKAEKLRVKNNKEKAKRANEAGAEKEKADAEAEVKQKEAAALKETEEAEEAQAQADKEKAEADKAEAEAEKARKQAEKGAKK